MLGSGRVAVAFADTVYTAARSTPADFARDDDDFPSLFPERL
jgi:hypothetical protein